MKDTKDAGRIIWSEVKEPLKWRIKKLTVKDKLETSIALSLASHIG